MGVRKAMIVLLLLPACIREEGPSDGPHSRGLEAGNPCALTSECRSGLICDPFMKTCACLDHDACGELFCHPVTGRCVRELPGCDGDRDCPANEYCDLERRICEPAHGFCEPCERDSQCQGAQSRCLEGGFCGLACAGDAECPTRTRCRRGQCTPELRCYEHSSTATGRCVDRCTEDKDCPGASSGDVCEAGLCRQPIGCDDLVACVPDTLWPCEKNQDCTRGFNQVCELGKCVARHSGCPFHSVCDPVTLACVPVCLSDGDCRQGRLCVAGTCRPEERCQEHEDCPAGKICACPKGKSCSRFGDFGVCKPECQEDSDCPMRTICAEDGRRRICKAGCRSASDCSPKEDCDMQTRQCVAALDTCQITRVCPFCQVCSQGVCVKAGSESTPHCWPCTEDSTCGQGGVCWEGSCALPCGAEGCPSGFGCGWIEADGVASQVCLPLDGSCGSECL